METGEVLNKAADLIEERGWVGAGGKGWLSEDDAPLCVEGAISAAMGDDIYKYGGFTSGPNLCPAGGAVRDYLTLGPYTMSSGLFMWNDAQVWTPRGTTPARTAAEVIEVLRACALIESAREEQDAAWETYAESVSA